jgi:hypothetical protein
VRVASSVTGGILLDIPPLDKDTTKTDEDGDGVADSAEGTASLNTFGGAPALLIGSDTKAITIGAVGTGDNAYGLIVRGGSTPTASMTAWPRRRSRSAARPARPRRWPTARA